jgi:hypothetical protein
MYQSFQSPASQKRAIFISTVMITSEVTRLNLVQNQGIHFEVTTTAAVHTLVFGL